MASEVERKLAAIMFTDIVGYSALMAESEDGEACVVIEMVREGARITSDGCSAYSQRYSTVQGNQMGRKRLTGREASQFRNVSSFLVLIHSP